MKNRGVLNAEIIREIAALGHTEYLCIADCGLPVPAGVKVIDISVAAGIPRFMDLLRTIHSELVVESYIVAAEAETASPELLAEIRAELDGLPAQAIPHEGFKEKVAGAKCVIRTGETTSFANIILIGGVNF